MMEHHHAAVQQRRRNCVVVVQAMDPFIKTYGLKGTSRKSLVQMETNTGHALTTDIPKQMGGSDVAPQPVETLLAALIGCTQATAIFVGRHMTPKILIEQMEFDIRAERDERGALTLPIEETPSISAKLQRVHGTIRVFAKLAPLSQEQLKILSEQTEARCPVANMMLASGCDMQVQWVDGTTI